MIGKYLKVSRRGLIIVPVFFILASIVWMYRSVWTTGQLKYVTAEIGSISHDIKVQAIFANEETPLQAPAPGKIQFLGADGQRFRRGEIVANIQADGAVPGGKSEAQAVYKIQAPIGGLFYQEVDSLELITPQNLLSMDLAKLLTQKREPQKPDYRVQTGEYIGKMVNNLAPTAAFVKVPTLDGLVNGQLLKFKVQDRTYSAKVQRRSENPLGIVVQFNQYVNGTTLEREQEIIWVSRPPANGVVIPKSALWTKGEELGVYVLQEGILQYRKVKVLDENDALVCVENLPIGISVVTNPRPGLDGLATYTKNAIGK